MIDFVTHIPDDAPKTVSCLVCGIANEIPWGEKGKNPFIPVAPNDFDAISNNRVWVPDAIGFPCKQCLNEVYFALPRKRKVTELHLYGDEAFDAGLNVFTYALTGADFKLLPKIEKNVSELKANISPDRDPLNWSLHMKNLWSREKRLKHKVFCNWNFQKVLTVVDAVAELIASLEKELFVYSITLTERHPFNNHTIDVAKYNCYTMLLLNVIDESTARGAQPKIHFDSEKNSGSSDRIIHQWAREKFGSAERKLIYTYLAKGISIPEPVFIKPASHPCSELADFISFWVRRYHVKREKGEPCELNLEDLGKLTYYGFTNTGDLLRLRQKGFPWSDFYER